MRVLSFGSLALNGRRFALLLALSFSFSAPAVETRVIEDPATGRILGLEDPDGTAVTYLYNSIGEAIGTTVRISETVSLTVRSDAETIAVEGMPKVAIVPDTLGRTGEVRADGRVIAEFRYRSSLHLSEVSLPGRLSVQLSAPDKQGMVRQTLIGHNGKVVVERLAGGLDGRPSPPVHLEIAAQELRLGDHRWESLDYATSLSNHLTTARDRKGNVVFYLVDAGRFSVAFTPDGRPAFIDIMARFDSVPLPAGSDAVYDPSVEVQAVAPNHVVLTASGMAGVYVQPAGAGALQVAWPVVGANGQLMTKYVLFSDDNPPS